MCFAQSFDAALCGRSACKVAKDSLLNIHNFAMLPETVLPAPEHHLHVGEEQLTKDLKESASTAAQGFNGELGVKHPRPLAPTAPPPPDLRRASSKQSPGAQVVATVQL